MLCYNDHMKKGDLIIVDAPHFNAGLIIGRDEYCVEAAPILSWALNKRRDYLMAYFLRKGWKATVVKSYHVVTVKGKDDD